MDHGRRDLAQRDQAAVVVEDRVLVGERRGDVDLRIVGIDLQPGRGGAEAGVGRGVPLHRGARVVAAVGPDALHHRVVRHARGGAFAVQVQRLDVLVVVDRVEAHVGHADLLALINVGRTLQEVQHGGEHLGRLDAEAAVVAVLRHCTRQVVVAPEQRVPALVGESGLPLAHHALELDQVEGAWLPLALHGVEGDRDVLELEHHRQLVAGRVRIQLRGLGRGAPGLAHGQHVAAAEGGGVHLLQQGVQARTVGHDLAIDVLADEVDDVHAEAADAALQPPVHHAVHFVLHLRVVPVEVGLAARELVEVVLAGGGIELPRRTAEVRALIVGLGTTGGGLAPDVVVAIRVFLRPARLYEPRVLVRAVVDHQVHDDADAAPARLGNQAVHVGQGAELGRDVLVVGDVVAVVVHRRTEHRRHPDHGDAELLQVVQARDDAGQVAHAIAVAIGKAARIDLVHHRVMPPLVFHIRLLILCVMAPRSLCDPVRARRKH